LEEHAHKPLVLTTSESADEAKTLLAAGARGYLTKQVGGHEIFQAIRDVHAGKTCGAKGVRAAAAAPEPSAKPKARRPFADWSLDLKMSAAALPVGASAEDGSLVPDLYLQGTVGEPLLLGTIRVD